MSRRRRRRRGGEGRRLEDDTADAFIKGEYEFCIEVGGEGGREGEERCAIFERGGGRETARGRRQVGRSVEETRRKNDEPEIISGVAERSRPNADVPSLYEKLMTSRSRQFPSSRHPPTLFHFPSAKFIPSSLLFFSLLFSLPPSLSLSFLLKPGFPLLPTPLLTISRVSTKFSRATIPDRLYNYPVLSSSG